MEAQRVQLLAEKGEISVPPQYIQPPETRPQNEKPSSNANVKASEVPVIDLSSRSNILEEVKRSCKEWGAFQVVNHKVPICLMDDMRRIGRSFFEGCNKMEDKLKYSCDSATPASEGYGSRMLVESNDTVLDWRDYFDHHTLPLSRRDPSHWPESPADYRKVVAEYSDHMKSLAQELLGLISESLGLTCQGIENIVGEFYQNITISYYPPCPQPELTLGLQSHSDMGAITLLIQDDVGGLEVFNNGEWVTVKPMSNAICVILADQTEIITNCECRSAQHRALTNAKRSRLSVATFHDPAKTRQISPAFQPPIYRPVIYGDYVSSWYTKGPEGKRNLDALLI